MFAKIAKDGSQSIHLADISRPQFRLNVLLVSFVAALVLAIAFAIVAPTNALDARSGVAPEDYPSGP